MSSIVFNVDMPSLEEINRTLGTTKDKSNQALKSAINRTATQTVKLLVDAVAEKYSIQHRKQVKKTMTIKKATVNRLTATIISRGRVNELYNFRVNPNIYVRGGGVPGGYKGRVLKGVRGKRLILKQGQTDGDNYKAFIVKYRSGHMTIGQRVPGKKMKSKPHKEFVKTLLSPSVPKMLGGEDGAFRKVEFKVYDLLIENVEKQAAKYITKSAESSPLGAEVI